MSLLHWTVGCTRLKSYSANTRQTASGPETTIKIELTTRDGYDLADLLRQLANAQAEQNEMTGPRHHPAPPPPARPSKPGKTLLLSPPPKALPAPPKQIPYFKD